MTDIGGRSAGSRGQLIMAENVACLPFGGRQRQLRAHFSPQAISRIYLGAISLGSSPMDRKDAIGVSSWSPVRMQGIEPCPSRSHWTSCASTPFAHSLWMRCNKPIQDTRGRQWPWRRQSSITRVTCSEILGPLRGEMDWWEMLAARDAGRGRWTAWVSSFLSSRPRGLSAGRCISARNERR